MHSRKIIFYDRLFDCGERKGTVHKQLLVNKVSEIKSKLFYFFRKSDKFIEMTFAILRFVFKFLTRDL